jgi:hypothetical protein
MDKLYKLCNRISSSFDVKDCRLEDVNDNLFLRVELDQNDEDKKDNIIKKLENNDLPIRYLNNISTDSNLFFEYYGVDN